MTGQCRRCGTPLIAGAAICPQCMLSAGAGDDAVCVADRWLLGDELGSGATGTVYRAVDRRTGRAVAVKILADHLADDVAFRRRFEREAAALSHLDDERIVAVWESGTWQDVPYIAMELVDGVPLCELGILPVERVLSIGEQVCAALEHAHRRGVVHRDIKPSNILVGADGQVKIADFGIARLLGDGSLSWTVTAQDRTSGTPHYMSPESLQGAPPDPRMDVYSIGAVLYEASTGALPIGSRRAAPWPVEPIVARALQPEAPDRFATAGEMGAALRRAADEVAAPRLPADERVWMRSVAVLLALATAATIWAVLVSLTPRVLAPDDIPPLTMVAPERLADGRLVSLARFETLPILGAAAMIALGLAGYGLLRHHWRRNGLDRPNASAAIDNRWVVALGMALMAIYIVGKPIEPFGLRLSLYVPVFAGILEFIVVFLFWDTVLECLRTARPVGRETTLWLGVTLAVMPPTVEFFTYVANWAP